MEGRELRRSYTQLEFPVTRVVRPQHHNQHYQQVRPIGKRYQQMTTSTASRAKFPTMEIYRPPNMRENSFSAKSPTETNSPKLNVYAKEFVMSAPLQPSKSTGSILTAVEDSAKQNSKSILHSMHKAHHNHHSLHHQQQSRGVQWIDENKGWTDNKITANHNSINPTGRDLKRSKSTGSSVPAVVSSVLTSPTTTPLAQELALFDGHPAEKLIKKTSNNINSLSCEELIELPRLILEKAIEDRAHAQSYATISMSIIERETGGTFLESLLNICQYTCEKKKNQKSGSDQGAKYHSFMAFLNELYSQMKPRSTQLKLCTGNSPTHTVLSLIVQVCQAVLSQKNLNARPEIECLFFTVTTVGRDLEIDDSKLLDLLMCAVRDAFLAPGTSQANKQTLLQLIELKAAKWHLPASTIMYYKNHAQI